MKKMKNFGKRSLSLLLCLIMIVGMLQITAFAAEGDDIEKVIEVEVEVVVDDNDQTNVSVDVDVNNRPTGSTDVDVETNEEYNNGENGTTGTGSNGVDVTVTVNGNVSSTPNLDANVSDGQNRPLHEEGQIGGKEHQDIDISETDVTPGDANANPTEKVDSDKINLGTGAEFNFDFNGENGFNKDNEDTHTKDQSSENKDININLDDLVDALIPTAAPTTEENGVKTEQKVEKLTKGNGWVTTTTKTTTTEGALTADQIGWAAPEGSVENEDGTFTLTTTEALESGGSVKTVTVYNPATGTFKKVVTEVTTDEVTVEQTAPGEVVVTGVNVGVLQGDGTTAGLSGLGPVARKKTDDELRNCKREDMVTAYNTDSASLADIAAWARLNNVAPDYVIPISHVILTGVDSKPQKSDGAAWYFNYGIESTVGINFKSSKEEGSDHSAWLREFKTKNKDGSEQSFWVYCTQKGFSDVKGTGYDIVNIGDATYYKINEGDKAKHIQYIAENGYWGSESGVGSLEAMKSLLTEEQLQKVCANSWNNYKATLESGITDGIALAATQAAIWYYANGVEGGLYKEDIFTKCWTNSNGTASGTLDMCEQEAAKALFNALINPSNDKFTVKETTDIISKEDIKGTSITVNDQLTGEELGSKVDEIVSKLEGDEKIKAEALYKSEDKNIYSTDLTLTVAVIPDKNTDDVTVYVYANNVRVASVPLTDGTTNNGLTTIKLEGVALPEGVNIRLNLSGAQKLTEGAYLFRSDIDYEKSQTMVGYVKGDNVQREVNLDVNMQFTVKAPEAEQTSNVTVTQTVTEERDWEWSAAWAKDYTYPTIPGPDPGPGPGDDDDDDSDVEIPDDPTPLDPGPGPEDDVEINDEDVPLSEIPDDEVEILDEDVPLAEVPATGDISITWYAAVVLSAAGLVCLTVLKKRDED